MRHLNALSLALAAVLLALGVDPTSDACLHAPDGFDGRFAQTAQQALILHRGGRQQLVLSTDVKLEPGAASKLPTQLAWVIPVPAAPDAYAVESGELFAQLEERWEKTWSKYATRELEPLTFDGGDDEDAEAEDPLALLPKVTVGRYEIQPLKATGEAGARALNAWLTAKGFAAVPAPNMRYYVQREWVWLAVVANLDGGKRPSAAQLKPLRISFASEQIVYPLLFSTHQGTFDVALWVVVEGRLTELDWQLSQYGFEADGWVDLGDARRDLAKAFGDALALLARRDLPLRQRARLTGRLDELIGDLATLRLPPAVQAIQKRAASEPGGWRPIEEATVYRLLGVEVNGPRNRLTAWKQDFVLAPATDLD